MSLKEFHWKKYIDQNTSVDVKSNTELRTTSKKSLTISMFDVVQYKQMNGTREMKWQNLFDNARYIIYWHQAKHYKQLWTSSMLLCLNLIYQNCFVCFLFSVPFQSVPRNLTGRQKYTLYDYYNYKQFLSLSFRQQTTGHTLSKILVSHKKESTHNGQFKILLVHYKLKQYI